LLKLFSDLLDDSNLIIKWKKLSKMVIMYSFKVLSLWFFRGVRKTMATSVRKAGLRGEVQIADFPNVTQDFLFRRSADQTSINCKLTIVLLPLNSELSINSLSPNDVY